MSTEHEGKSLGYSIRFGFAHAALIVAMGALRFSCWCLRIPDIDEETPAAS
jgi:hypothetical protein